MSKQLNVLQSQVTDLLQASRDQSEAITRIMDLLETQQKMFMEQMQLMQKEQNKGWSREAFDELIDKAYNFLTIKALREKLSQAFEDFKNNLKNRFVAAKDQIGERLDRIEQRVEGVARELTGEMKDLKEIVTKAFSDITQAHQLHKQNIENIMKSGAVNTINELQDYQLEENGQVEKATVIQKEFSVVEETVEMQLSSEKHSNVLPFPAQEPKNTLRDILAQHGKLELAGRVSAAKLNGIVVEHGISEKDGKITLKYKLENEKRFSTLSLGSTENVQSKGQAKSEALAR
ncbi:hypothetical protein ABHN11_24580 [Brevibacillus centrosporus]|uniref:hypothetical protein n=1 Tax=Brevibacillus centrosporus TaxID=54910 RepID=UPI003D207724